MAFSKTPQTSTYQTKSVSLLNEWETRDATSTKDTDAINCHYEIVQNKRTGEKDYNVVKRDGSVLYPLSGVTLTGVRAFFYWEDEDKLLIADNNDIFVVTASTGVAVTTLSNVFSTTSGAVGFCEFLFDTNNVKIVATDGATLITIDTANTVVTSASPDLPAPHLPVPVFLNGYLFLVKTDTADIYNSDLNDPLAWTAGNFIVSEMYADTVKTIANHNNYLVVFGSSSIEYFWDAANASGSPLQRYDSPVRRVGYVTGLVNYENELFFIGKAENANPQVYNIKDLKLQPLGTPPIRRATVPYTSAYAALISYGGHDFYHITLGSLSYQFELTGKLWTKTAFKTTAYMPIEHATSVVISGVGNVTLFTVNGVTALYYLKPGVYQDDGVTFTTTIITDNQMFDTYNRKTCARAIVVADRPASNGTLAVSWTDDDFQSYSTARNMELNVELPQLTRLGQFRRRAFKLVWIQNLPLRVKKIDLDLNMDQS